MFRRKVSCTVGEDNLAKVIKTLSEFGSVIIDSTQDKHHYILSVICNTHDDVSKCLESLLILSQARVLIRRPNVNFTL